MYLVLTGCAAIALATAGHRPAPILLRVRTPRRTIRRR